MNVRSVKVSITPLLQPSLTTTAQVIYAAVCQDADMDPRLLFSPTRLGRVLGLSRPTIRKGIAQLAQAGYLQGPTDGRYQINKHVPGRRVTMPYDLLIDQQVRNQAKVLYGVLQTVCYDDEWSQCKYTQLAQLTHRNVKTIRSAFRELAQAGWVKAVQGNRKAPVRFSVRHPITDRVIAEAVAAQTRIANAPFKGEAICKELASLLFDPTSYEDNVHLEGLINPLTEAPLEVDRKYDCGVVVEFHGPQHFRGTNKYSDNDSIIQQVRDAIKIAICMRQGIKLVEVLPSDLSVEGMLKKFGNLLPLRNLYGYQPMIKLLEDISRQYRAYAKNWMPLGLEKTYGRARAASNAGA